MHQLNRWHRHSCLCEQRRRQECLCHRCIDGAAVSSSAKPAVCHLLEGGAARRVVERLWGGFYQASATAATSPLVVGAIPFLHRFPENSCPCLCLVPLPNMNSQEGKGRRHGHGFPWNENGRRNGNARPCRRARDSAICLPADSMLTNH